MTKIGRLAPNFSLPDQTGKLYSLADYKGQWVLLYFYPKDDTPGCTVEACGFRDNFPKLKQMDAVILGVSADNLESHGKFTDKYKLPFTILSDENKGTIKAYGVWGEKKFMGRTYMGIRRMSFLIDPKGIIVKVYEKVKAAEHPVEVLVDLAILSKS